jgi:hypothetical protein
MTVDDIGLTSIYDRFNSPDTTSSPILELRELHASIDRAVLDGYGWTDIQTRYEFLLDFEDEEGDENAAHRKKKPWRYRWPDEIRDEVLARLLELNRQRALEEGVAGGDNSASKAKPSTKKASKGKASSQVRLIPGLLSEEKR